VTAKLCKAATKPAPHASGHGRPRRAATIRTLRHIAVPSRSGRVVGGHDRWPVPNRAQSVDFTRFRSRWPFCTASRSRGLPCRRLQPGCWCPSRFAPTADPAPPPHTSPLHSTRPHTREAEDTDAVARPEEGIVNLTGSRPRSTDRAAVRRERSRRHSHAGLLAARGRLRRGRAAVARPAHGHLRGRYLGLSLCCMGQRCGRTEPDPCVELCDADVLRASEVQHVIQRVGGDGDFGPLPPVRARTQPVADDALPSRDVGLDSLFAIAKTARVPPPGQSGRRSGSRRHRR
jgi:hypothetical protein